MACDAVLSPSTSSASASRSVGAEFTEEADGSRSVAPGSLRTADADALISYVLSLGFDTFALPEVAGCGPVLSKPHSASPGDTWLFGNKSFPIFVKGSKTAELDATFVASFRQVYGAQISHLAIKGWRNKTRAVFLDEPSGSVFNVGAVNNIHALFDQLGIQVQQTEYNKAFKNVSSWTIKSDAYSKTLTAALHAQAAPRAAELLVYSNAIAIIDLPAIRARSFPWQIWRSNINGTGFGGWGSETGFYGSTKVHIMIPRL